LGGFPLNYGKGEMRVLSVAVLFFLSVASAFSQAPRGAQYTSESDLYVGYITTFPDYGPQIDSYRFNGAELAYTKTLLPHWAVTASGSAVFGSVFDAKQISATAGAKYNFLTGRVRPYATAQIGYARLSTNHMYSGDHHPPLPAGTRDIESGLTYRGGLGVDLQMSRGFYWRAIQWDVQPQPWGRNTPFYYNFGSGLGYRF
jgi:outer membrane protein W